MKDDIYDALAKRLLHTQTPQELAEFKRERAEFDTQYSVQVVGERDGAVWLAANNPPLHRLQYFHPSGVLVLNTAMSLDDI